MNRLWLALGLVAACGDDTGAAAVTSVGASATNGSGGSGGAPSDGGGGSAGGAEGGGTIGSCPNDAQETGDSCGSVDLLCSYDTSCCICENLGCAVQWSCADAADAVAGCPTAVPPAGTACGADLTCPYCTSEGPVVRHCDGSEWVDEPIGVCP